MRSEEEIQAKVKELKEVVGRYDKLEHLVDVRTPHGLQKQREILEWVLFESLKEELQLTEGWLNFDKEPVLFVKYLQKHFNSAQIKVILDFIDNICHYCWDYDTTEYSCQCSNDE